MDEFVTWAVSEQEAIASRVVIPDEPMPAPSTVAGLDVSYAAGSDQMVAAAVVVDVADGSVLEEAVVDGHVALPYVPGLLAFREVPVLVEVLERLDRVPGLVLCDGHGLAHPRRCGLACPLGAPTGLPAIGSAKNHFIGEHAEPGPRRGTRTALVDRGERVGGRLRTQDGVRPV